MKNDIHPEYVLTQVTCSCGNTFTTRSTAKGGSLHADVCSACHPFYTGKQKIMDVGGRVDKFEKRFGKRVRNSSQPRRRSGAPARGAPGRRRHFTIRRRFTMWADEATT
jgi:large subunit ribosomal protein L31